MDELRCEERTALYSGGTVVDTSVSLTRRQQSDQLWQGWVLSLSVSYYSS